MRARFMDPQLGRFTQEDPAVFGGGDTNLYRYVGNNPVTQRDPTGRVAAIEYATLIEHLEKIDAYCEFSKCVAKIWGDLTVSVLTLTPAVPEDDICGLELLNLPQPNLKSILTGQLKSKIKTKLGNTPAGLLFAAYNTAKACQGYVQSLPSGKPGPP
jgi:uncharacterized protein RhaS with RHS repeats